MLDYIIRYDLNGKAIWHSETHWINEYIGYIDSTGKIHYYEED